MHIYNTPDLITGIIGVLLFANVCRLRRKQPVHWGWFAIFALQGIGGFAQGLRPAGYTMLQTGVEFGALIVLIVLIVQVIQARMRKVST